MQGSFMIYEFRKSREDDWMEGNTDVDETQIKKDIISIPEKIFTKKVNLIRKGKKEVFCESCKIIQEYCEAKEIKIRTINDLKRVKLKRENGKLTNKELPLFFFK